METKEAIAKSQADTKQKVIKITLEVKAHDLYNLRSSELNVDQNTTLRDNEGDRIGYGDSNHDFETRVHKKQRICWEIALNAPNGEDGDYIVALNYVEHNPSPGNPNFFNKERLLVKKNGKIKGKISNDPLTPLFDDIYTIYFTITPPKGVAGGPQTFPVDPKIRIIGGGE